MKLAEAAILVNRIKCLKTRAEKKALWEETLSETDDPSGLMKLITGSIRTDGIGYSIFVQGINEDSESNPEISELVRIMNKASDVNGKLRKLEALSELKLSPSLIVFVTKCMYGNIKLGITFNSPIPEWGKPFRPMLCDRKDFDPKSPMMLEEKYDGIRLLGYHMGDDSVTLYSRNGKRVKMEAIEEAIRKHIPRGVCLDGEAVAPSGEFQDLDRHGDVKYAVFDMPFREFRWIGETLLISRRKFLEFDISENSVIEVSRLLGNFNSLEYLDGFLKGMKMEGTVAKDPMGTYDPNERHWIKRKPYKLIKAKVVGWHEGTGKRKDGLGAILVIPEGVIETTQVGSGFSDKDLQIMKERLDKKIPTIVKVKYQEATKRGRLRFPVFKGILGGEYDG